jgi:hypothetical protein
VNSKAGGFLVAGAVLVSIGLTSTLAQSGASREPLRIGVLEDMTGPLASIGGPANVVAAQMAVEDLGGQVDYASFILQAQGSKAQIVAVANVSSDLVNSVKSSTEFGVVAGDQKLAAMQQADVAGLGLNAAKGLITTSVFFCGMNADTRSFGDRYAARFSAGGCLAQTRLRSIPPSYTTLKPCRRQALDSDDAVATAMRCMLVTDFVNKDARVRGDGRLLRDLFLMQVKAPEDVRFPGDFYTVLAKIGPEKAFAKDERRVHQRKVQRMTERPTAGQTPTTARGRASRPTYCTRRWRL